MKRYILMTLVCAFAVVSCYKDDSGSTDYSKLENGVRIKGTIQLFWTVSTVDEPYLANFTPELEYFDTKGMVRTFADEDYEKYDYRWRLARTAGTGVSDTLRYTISNQRSIEDYLVEFDPNAPYTLLLELTEKGTGLRYNLMYYAYIGAAGGIGNGLMIADTRDGGTTSDISILRAYPWCPRNQAYSTPADGMMPVASVAKDLYSKNNGGQKIDGRVTSLVYTFSTTAGRRHIDVVSEGKHVIRLGDTNFAETGRDGALFTAGLPATFNPQVVQAQSFIQSYQRVVLVNNNQLYTYRQNNDNAFLFEPVTQTSADITNNGTVDIDEHGAITAILMSQHGQYYDKTAGRIVPIFNGPGTHQLQPFLYNTTKSPAPNALTGYDCLYSGIWSYGYNYGYSGDLIPPKSVWVMDKSGARYLYVMAMTPTSRTVISEDMFDMSGCTDFDLSTAWANSYVTTRNNYGNTNRSQPELFYAVGNKIYSVTPTAGSNPTSKLVFTFPDNEEVSTMRWHIEQNYSSLFSGWDGEDPIWMAGDSCNNLLTVATWDGTEGRVYGIPRLFPGTGVLVNSPETPDNDLVFQQGGFGEVTAMFPRQQY